MLLPLLVVGSRNIDSRNASRRVWVRLLRCESGSRLSRKPVRDVQERGRANSHVVVVGKVHRDSLRPESGTSLFASGSVLVR